MENGGAPMYPSLYDEPKPDWYPVSPLYMYIKLINLGFNDKNSQAWKDYLSMQKIQCYAGNLEVKINGDLSTIKTNNPEKQVIVQLNNSKTVSILHGDPHLYNQEISLCDIIRLCAYNQNHTKKGYVLISSDNFHNVKEYCEKFNYMEHAGLLYYYTGEK